MRLWWQLPLKIDPGSPNFKPYLNALEKESRSVRGPDTEIVIKHLDAGLESLEDLGNDGLRFLNDREILKAVLPAEKEGYDGVVIFCYLDPALRSSRQFLNIPVVGIAEASMHMACMMGCRFAVITSDPGFIPAIRENIHRYGLYFHTIERNSIKSINLSTSEFLGCLAGDHTPVIENFQEVARGLIEDGAEVIIAGCGLLSVMLSRKGVSEIDGVPIIDPVLVAVKLAEAMVDLNRKGIPIISRKGIYREVSTKKIF